MNDELKPCPFCGGEARFARGFNYGELGSIRWVYCSKCGAMTRSDFHKTKEDAAVAWNTRWRYHGDTIECYECAIGGYEAAHRSVEENIKAQGYVKERTCRNVSEVDYGFKCSECGDWEDIDHPKYCAHCGAKVVE